jgi:geranylgeranyl diphosphate synthase type II
MNSTALLAQTRTLVDEYIAQLFENKAIKARQVGKTYESLWRNISDVAAAGGKRIRPYLVMVGNGALDTRVVPVAVAQELVHIAMLMHDDVIDQDFIRHGTKNISGIYKDAYGSYLNDDALAVHYGHSAAILSGDALISEAYVLIARSEFEYETKQRITQQLQTSMFELIGGELMDVEAGFMNGEQFDPMQIYRYKTASYSFIGPLLSGAYCANLEQPIIELLETYATNIGIAFQIQDDLLGVFGDEKETGKSSTMNDIREGKRTLLIANHERNMNQQQRQRFEAVFGASDVNDDGVRAFKEDLQASGAKETTYAQAERYFALASEALSALPDGERKHELLQFTQRLQNRSK